MDKKLILIMTLFLISVSVFANDAIVEDLYSSGSRGSSGSAGSFKAGVALGYPTGVTAGWRITDKFELNGLLGTKYTGFTIGVTPLFTLTDLNIADQPMPLSLGPQINLNTYYGYVDLDILAALRLEYTLPNTPVNFYVEGGLGININFYSSAYWGFSDYSSVRIAGSGALGVRYVF
jgi:hypothetical protein